ncbi:UNVERIFIED_ORG: AraC-like DNA-binding protein [Arthrobacter globiformis]|nr:AraC-like DNA-binding protein [Arthrobacter globiformis]
MMNPPFAIDVQDKAALTVVVVVQGCIWVQTAENTPQLLGPGQTATVRGPAAYLIADAPDRAPTVVIGPDQSCRTPAGEHLETTMAQGLRTWGNAPDGNGETVLLIGTYFTDAAAGRLVTSVLPALAVFSEEETDSALLKMLEREITTPGLGQESALDRVLDLLLLHLVRVCVDRSTSGPPSWAAGTRDPAVATALALLHEDPAAPWTIAELARKAHVSRATLAARFHAAVGQPPMSYLTTWRLALAADKLASSTATTAAIAAAIGYSNAFSFSNAFTRAYGTNPTNYRRTKHA